MSTSLDLGHVDPPIWRVLVKDKPYGPYTLGQMQAFIEEGRIGLQTRVAKGEEAPIVTAENVKELQPALREKYISTASKSDDEYQEQPRNYVVISRLSGSADDTLLRKLNTYGSFGEAMPGVYLLRSRNRISDIQKGLQSVSNIRDQMLIVDASNDRLGWFNLGPEADVHIRTIWDKEIT